MADISKVLSQISEYLEVQSHKPAATPNSTNTLLLTGFHQYNNPYYVKYVQLDIASFGPEELESALIPLVKLTDEEARRLENKIEIAFSQIVLHWGPNSDVPPFYKAGIDRATDLVELENDLAYGKYYEMDRLNHAVTYDSLRLAAARGGSDILLVHYSFLDKV